MGRQQGYVSAIRSIYTHDGLRGFYRGGVPAFNSLSLSTLATFGIFEAFHTIWEHNETMLQPLPGSGGLELRTLTAGFLAGALRTIYESPFEYIKVKS